MLCLPARRALPARPPQVSGDGGEEVGVDGSVQTKWKVDAVEGQMRECSAARAWGGGTGEGKGGWRS